MAIGYTSVNPGDANPGWVDWRANIDGETVLDFFNKFAAQSGDMARCNRNTVMNDRMGIQSFNFDLVESFGFEARPCISVTVVYGDQVISGVFPFNPQSNDDVVETRNWLCGAHAWTRQQFGAKNVFKIADTCPLLPDPPLNTCSPCFEIPPGGEIQSVLALNGNILAFNGSILAYSHPR